jgi:hypothetical protein
VRPSAPCAGSPPLGPTPTLAEHCCSIIGDNTDPERLERTLAEDIATAMSEEWADLVLVVPA